MRNAAARGGAKIGTFSLFFTHFVASLVKASFSFLYLSASLRIRLLIIVIWNGRIKDVLRLRYIGFVIYIYTTNNTLTFTTVVVKSTLGGWFSKQDIE